MSSVNNNNLQPIDPSLTPPTSDTSTSPTANSAYYASDIAPATTIGAKQAVTGNAATPVLMAPDGTRITMASYGRAMAEYVRKFTDSSYENQMKDISMSVKFYKGMMASILEIESLINTGNQLQQNVTELMNQYKAIVEQYNAQIENFNKSALTPEDQAAMKAMNDAIAQYNKDLAAYNKAKTDNDNGNISADQFDAATKAFENAQSVYNTAVNTYNAYGENRNKTLPSLIQDFNTNLVGNFDTTMKPLYDLIDQYNSIAVPAGGTAIPYPAKPSKLDPKNYTWDPLTTSPTDPVSLLPSRPADVPTLNTNLSLKNIQKSFNAITAFINAMVDKLLANFQNALDDKKTTDAAAEYYKTKNQLKYNSLNPILDNRSIKTNSQQIFETGNAFHAQGDSSTSASNLNGRVTSPDFTSILQNTLELKNPKSKDPFALPNTLLRVASEQYLIAAGLLSGKNAIASLGKDLSAIQVNGNASKVAVALGFSKQLQQLSGTDVYENGVEQALKAGNLPPNTNTVDKIASDLRLNGALMSLFQISRAINAPGLTGQMLTMAGGATIPSVKAALDSSKQTTISDVLNDPISKNYLKESLIDVLTSDGDVSKESAMQLIENAVDNVAKDGTVVTENDLKNSLNREFTKQNISASQVETLTQEAMKTVKDEQQRPGLSFAFNLQDLQTAIKNDPLFTNLTLTTAVNDTLKNSEIYSQRQFRTELINELRLNGVSRDIAMSYANQTIDAVDGVRRKNPPPADPLVQANSAPFLTEEQFKDAVFKKAVQQLQTELPIAKSHEIAGELVATLLGDDQNSVLNILKDKIQTAKNDDTKTAEETLASLTKTYLAPRVELFAFAEALNDPGNSILYSAASGIMYSGNQPQKHENALQIPV